MNGQPTSHRNRSHLGRAVFLLGVVAIALIGVARPAAGQQGAGGFAVRFEGTFRIGGQPAPASSEIKVITARSATDTFICGTGAIRDGGSFQIDVAPAQRCADQGNAGGPVAFIFLYKGERVGGSSKHIDLNRPATLGRTDRVSLSAPDIPDLRDSTQTMVAMRFYGTFRINGQPAPAGTAITVLTARSATDETVCGTGTVSDGGHYYVDIEPLERCADNGNAGGPVRFSFRSSTGEQVGSAGQHLDLNRPATLGHLNRVSLSGRNLPGSSPPPVLSSGASVTVTPAPETAAPAADTPAVAASATLVVGRGAGACLLGGTGTCVPELAGGAARFGPLGCAAGATLFWGYLCVTEVPAAAARMAENAQRLQVGTSIPVSNTSQSRQPSPRPQASPLPAADPRAGSETDEQRRRCGYQGEPPIV